MLSSNQTNFISFILSAILLLTIVQNCSNPVEPIKPSPTIDSTEVCNDTIFRPLSTEGLIPLTVGNYWEYKLETYIYGDTIPQIITNYTVQGITKKHYALFECNLYEAIVYDRSLGGPDEWLFWQDSTGYYGLGGMSDKDTLINKSLLWEYPVEEGESWKSLILFFNKATQKFEYGDTIKYTCVSTNRKFDTPAGKFSCYVFYYRTDIAPDVSGFYDVYDYVNPEIGIIGQEVFITIEEFRETESWLNKKAMLVDYFIKTNEN